MTTRILSISMVIFLLMIPAYANSPQNQLSANRGSEVNELRSVSASDLTKAEHVAQSPGVNITEDNYVDGPLEDWT